MIVLADLIQPRITELGKIKIGQKGAERTSQKGGTYRMPEKLDHFLLTTLNRDQGGQLILDKALMTQLAQDGYADEDGKIRRLPVHLLSDDIEDIVQASYVYYNGKRCGMRSDGKIATWFCNPKEVSKWLDKPLELPWNPALLDWKANGNPLVKLHTTFSCVVRSQGSRFGGVHRFRTTSRITAEQLVGCLTEILSLTGGILVGLPLQLVVRPMQVAPDGKTTNVYVVHCELAGADLKQIQQQALDQIRFRLTYQKEMGRSLVEYRKMLTAPGHETDPADILDVIEEFHPEEEERPSVPMPKAIGEAPASVNHDTNGHIEPDPSQSVGPAPGQPSDDDSESVPMATPDQIAALEKLAGNQGTLNKWRKYLQELYQIAKPDAALLTAEQAGHEHDRLKAILNGAEA